MPPDPRDAPELVRVPVSTLVDYRALLSTAEALRGDVAGLRAEVGNLRGDLAAHVAAEKPVLDAHGGYLASLASQETTAAARAVAERRTADDEAAADASKLRATLTHAAVVVVTAIASGLAVYFGASP